MNAFLTLINIIVLVIFIVILHMMARKHISFAKRVFTALGIGIVFGVLLHLIYGTHSNVITSTSDWFNIVGQGLRCIVANDCYAFNFHFYCSCIH